MYSNSMDDAQRSVWGSLTSSRFSSLSFITPTPSYFLSLALVFSVIINNKNSRKPSFHKESVVVCSVVKDDTCITTSKSLSPSSCCAHTPITKFCMTSDCCRLLYRIVSPAQVVSSTTNMSPLILETDIDWSDSQVSLSFISTGITGCNRWPVTKNRWVTSSAIFFFHRCRFWPVDHKILYEDDTVYSMTLGTFGHYHHFHTTWIPLPV
jgi:hypothetical protein